MKKKLGKKFGIKSLVDDQPESADEMVNKYGTYNIQHQRPADSHTDDHHKGHLYIYNVGSHPCNQTGYREFINIFKRILLNPVKHILAQVARKPRGSGGAGISGCNAQNQR